MDEIAGQQESDSSLQAGLCLHDAARAFSHSSFFCSFLAGYSASSPLLEEVQKSFQIKLFKRNQPKVRLSKVQDSSFRLPQTHAWRSCLLLCRSFLAQKSSERMSYQSQWLSKSHSCQIYRL